MHVFLLFETPPNKHPFVCAWACKNKWPEIKWLLFFKLFDNSHEPGLFWKVTFCAALYDIYVFSYSQTLTFLFCTNSAAVVAVISGSYNGLYI